MFACLQTLFLPPFAAYEQQMEVAGTSKVISGTIDGERLISTIFFGKKRSVPDCFTDDADIFHVLDILQCAAYRDAAVACQNGVVGLKRRHRLLARRADWECRNCKPNTEDGALFEIGAGARSNLPTTAVYAVLTQSSRLECGAHRMRWKKEADVALCRPWRHKRVIVFPSPAGEILLYNYLIHRSHECNR